MDLIDRARKYVQNCPPAIDGQGGHNQTYSVAVALVNGFGLPESDAMALMMEYNQSCVGPWSEKEIVHKVKTAISTPHDKPRGHLAGPGTHRSASGNTTTTPRKSEKPKEPKKPYNVSAEGKIPDPIADGAREFIRAAFKEGEGVRIQIARTNEDGKEIPKDGGITLSREEWLRKLDECNGEPNGILSNSSRNGIYCAINPYKLGCTKDADVTAYRHALIEFDHISKEEQWQLYSQSNIPCTAVIYSGGDSLHAWVKVDAKDRREYDERVRILYEHFAAYGVDPKNKNVGRFSRLPNCVRGEKRQELLALNIGAESFSDWLARSEIEGTWRRVSQKDLLGFNPKADPNCLLGDRWLCRGGSAFLIAQSGAGKSSFVMQMAIHLALGRSFFGICPTRPLKVLILQAENDDGDLAEMYQGVWAGLGLMKSIEDGKIIYDMLEKNLCIEVNSAVFADEFCRSAHRSIEQGKYDIVFADPFLSFYGEDASNQAACTQFLRKGINPILSATGVCWIWTHHTAKPSSDPKSKKGWTTGDFSYIGAGSAEMVNWARALMYLHAVDEQTWRLLFTKRGPRAGAIDMLGKRTREIFLRYSTTGIYWEQVHKPEIDEEAKPSKKVEKTEQGPIKFDLEAFFESVDGQFFTVTRLFQKLQDFGVTNRQFYGDEKKSGLWQLMQKRMFFYEEAKVWVYRKSPPEEDPWG